MTAPSPTTTAPQAAPASTTTITLDGKEIELKGMTAEQTATLYGALPPEYKQRADAYAKIAKNVERVIKGLPEGMTIGQALEKYKKAFDSTGQFLKERADPWMEQFHALNLPLFSATHKLDRATDKAGRLMDGFTAPMSDTVGFVDNVGKLLGVLSAEATGAAKGALGVATVSDAQAKALGTVFAAAEFHESAVRQGLSTTELSMKHMGAAGGAALEHATSTTAWTYVVAAFKFVANLLSSYFGDDKKKYDGMDFTQRLAKVWEQSKMEARADQAAKNPDLTYEQRLEARVKAGEIDRAAAKLKSAGIDKNFGLPEGTVDAAAGKAPFVATNGTLNQTTPDASGTPEAKPALTEDGKPIGRGDRVQEAAAGVIAKTTGALQNADKAIIAVTGAGAVATGATIATVANNGAKGFVRSITAHVTDPTPATEKLMQWAKKPVQFGFGEHAITGLKGKLLNWPGTFASGIGRATGWLTVKAASLVGGTAQFAANHAAIIKTGATAWGAVVSPAIETTRLVQGKMEGNDGKVENASNALTVIAADAAIGATAGAVILGPVGAAGGAVLGATVGGVVTLAGELFDSKELRGFNRVSEEIPAKPAGALGASEKGMELAIQDATKKAEQARLAQVAKDSPDAVRDIRMAAGTVFARVASVQPGTGNVTPTANLPHSSAAQASLPPMA